MKNGWPAKSIGDLCVLRPSKAEARRRVANDAEVSFLPMEDLGIDVKHPRPTKSRQLKEVEGSYTYFADGDVLLAKITPCFQNGKLGIAKGLHNGIGFGSSEFFVLRPNAQLDPEYLYYFLSRDDFRQAGVLHMSGAVGQQRVPPDFLLSQRIVLPSLQEQRRIVGILDGALDGISSARANAEKNRQNADELFQSILTEAITGRLSLDWRRVHSKKENASGELKQRLTQRRNQWKGGGKYTEPAPPAPTSGLDIPDNWTWASPEQLSTHIVDCPHSTPRWTQTGVLCLRTTNFTPKGLALDSVQFVSEETYNERIMRLEPKAGDVLYSREGGILGIACIIPSDLKVCLGQRMMQFRLDSSIALPQYFTAVLNSPFILTAVKRLTGGAASPHLNIRDIRTLPIPLPPLAEQRMIVAQLDALSAHTRRLESLCQQKRGALDALKKSLLHQAFSGDLQ